MSDRPPSFFFFSSRRRHTRCYRDWSSDVCSSDLYFPLRLHPALAPARTASTRNFAARRSTGGGSSEAPPAKLQGKLHGARSEERRVGKECRSRWSADD